MIYFIAKSQSLEQYETWCSERQAWIRSGRPVFYTTPNEALEAFKTLSDNDKVIAEIRGHDYEARFSKTMQDNLEKYKRRRGDVNSIAELDALIKKRLG